MGYDIAGVVASAPTGSAFKAGDEVYARLPNRRLGAYAERAVVPVGLLARKPRSLSFEEAASLPTVAVTTWQAFTERAHLKSGERVLIQAGAGGVGAFAVQLAKHMGAFVVATGGPGSQDFMAKLGADRTIDYTREKFEDAGPFDVVYDGVCGPLVKRGIDALREGGTMSVWSALRTPSPFARLVFRRQSQSKLRQVSDLSSNVPAPAGQVSTAPSRGPPACS
jgi:NADPH:quinone reductase-like Zn-dependent oxidoreductase